MNEQNYACGPVLGDLKPFSGNVEGKRAENRQLGFSTGPSTTGMEDLGK